MSAPTQFHPDSVEPRNRLAGLNLVLMKSHTEKLFSSIFGITKSDVTCLL